nr:hypothetical transcript [Hymenolepis microstoma]
MDFSNAPIAVADVDELSCTGESDHTELIPDGLLKRSLSDPFDISAGLQLEASLEHLIWTFDDDVSHGLLDSHNLNGRDVSRDNTDKKVTLDAIKSFWRISVAPIENPRKSYPLEKMPITYDMEDLHMADAESVSEAEFEAFSPNTDVLLERERLARMRLERLEMGEDDPGTTDLTGPISTTSWECISNSSSSLNGKSISPIPPTMPHLLADWDQTTMTFAEGSDPLEGEPVPDVSEDRTLEDNLRRAGLQAALETFKAKYPTLPLKETSGWERDASLTKDGTSEVV